MPKHHAIVCKECGADLTVKSSVNIHFVVSEHEFDAVSELDKNGLLIDRDRLVENDYHAGTFCQCGELCDELHHPEVQHHEGGGEG